MIDWPWNTWIRLSFVWLSHAAQSLRAFKTACRPISSQTEDKFKKVCKWLRQPWQTLLERLQKQNCRYALWSCEVYNGPKFGCINVDCTRSSGQNLLSIFKISVLLRGNLQKIFWEKLSAHVQDFHIAERKSACVRVELSKLSLSTSSDCNFNLRCRLWFSASKDCNFLSSNDSLLSGSSVETDMWYKYLILNPTGLIELPLKRGRSQSQMHWIAKDHRSKLIWNSTAGYARTPRWNTNPFVDVADESRYIQFQQYISSYIAHSCYCWRLLCIVCHTA